MKFLNNAIFNGTITANSVADAGVNTDKFLVLNSSGLVTYRTAAELYSDLNIANLPSGYTSVVKHQVKLGEAINKGQAAYVPIGFNSSTNMVVMKASNASEATSSKTMGLIETSGVTNDFVNIVTEGLLAGIDTSTATQGDPVWLGTGGNLIFGLTNKPYAPAHLVFLGIVTRVNQVNGEIFVKVQNGFELEELHNVDLKTTTPINGHILGYNGTLWVNKTIAGWLGFTPANSATTISTTAPLQGGGDLSANRTLSITQATSSTSGYLSSTDWVTFNSKQSALSGNGFVKITGTTISYDNTSYLPLTGGTMYGNLLTTYPILSDSSISLSETGTITNYGNYTNFTGTPNGLKFIFGGGLTGAITFDTFGIIIKNHFGNTAALSHVTGANLTFNLPSSSGTLALTSDIPSLSGYVPTSRTITINGTTYDLSANRSWTVTSMVYPSAGIAVSTGTAWGTSITDNSSNWNTAYGWGNHASAGYVPGARTLTINGTTYDLTANRSWTIDSTTASTRVVQKYTADGTTATYTVTNGYTVGMVDVYVNGIKLDNASGVEFTATNGTTVVLTSTPASGDIVEVYKYGSQFIANNALRQVTAFTATAGQTVFTVSYSVGYVDVFYNGSKLAASEYTATNGTSITLGTACVVNDIVEVVAYSYTVGAFTGIGGSGTANYLSKFTASGTIGDSNIQINSSGQVGFFGQAPRSNSAVKTLESVNYVIEDNGDFGFKSNAYYNGTNNVYINSAPATRLYAGSGNFEFYTAPSGTAGSTTTFTSRFYISNSGNVGIATSSPSYKLDISAVGYGIQHYADASNYLRTYCGSTYQIIESNGTNQFGYVGGNFFVQTSATERMRITSGGNVGIGTTNPTYGKLQLNSDSQDAFAICLASNANQQLVMGYNLAGNYGRIQSVNQGVSYTNLVLQKDGGNVGIGNSDPQIKLHVVAGSGTGTTTAFCIERGSGYGATFFKQYYNSGSDWGLIVQSSTNADGVKLVQGATSWTSNSDERLKNIIEPISNATDKINTLRAVIGKYKTDDEDKRRLFLIAQDVQNVFPEVVDIDGTEDAHMGIRYTELIPVLVKAIQEQQKQIDDLKKLIN